MKRLAIFSLFSICLLAAKYPMKDTDTKTPMPSATITAEKKNESKVLTFQPQQEPGKMRSIVFKSQEFCRAEIPDFEFDVHFSIISATVYFSGANFKGVERGTITGPSLKPLKPLMDRCIPGSLVVFDDIKVLGPDKTIRTIAGVSYLLY